MDRPSLDNPRAKLARAAEHLEALWGDLRDFTAREPHSIVQDPELDDGWRVIRFRESEKPPVGLGLVFGDFIHNLRSALDNLVCQLALADGASSCDTTQFPVCRTPAQFAKKRGQWLAGVSGEHIAAIEAMQPYEDRDGPLQKALVAVRDFDNIDKHRTIHATVVALNPDPAALVVRREPIEAEFEIEMEYVTVNSPLEDGAIIARTRIRADRPPPKPVAISAEVPVRVGFGEVGLNVDALPDIWRAVQEIVESFASTFRRLSIGRR